ncbi:ATP/GTP-binding protein [Streptomyces sp. NPDC056663]|uniref:ATP/GTP-binding protein n=1 Tax=Streptomyces sp. NPDC056663 TaxID=3345899 RepID=UPI0036817440
MSDVDDPNGILVRGPWSGESSYVPPPMPDYADTMPDPEDISEAPPDSPEETTMELPQIPTAPDPEMALRADGITAPETGEDDAEYEDGEYVQPRSLADRLGDWLELRIEMARARHEGEIPFRETEIARKAALLEGRTAQEVAMMEQNGKLHAAMMKAKGDKAAARGKADADRMKSTGSGLGADKGRSKDGGGGGSSRGNGNSSGSGGRSGSGQSGGGGKGGTKGPDRSSGGRTGGSGHNGSSGGSKGSHTGSGSSGRNGSSKGDGSRAQHGPASNTRAERARGRQERRNAGHDADIAERTKNRDQARANRQKDWEDRRAKKAERDAARKSKRETAASTESGRTTLGAAVSEEARRRWDKRRADEKDGKPGTEKVSLSKDKDKDKDKDKGANGKDKDKDKGANGKDDKAAKSSAGKDGPAPDEPGKASKAGDEPSDGSRKRRRFRRRRTSGTGRAGWWGRTGRAGRRGRSSDSPFGPDDSAPNVEWPDRPTRTSRPAGGDEEDIEDAVVVPDGPASVTTGVKDLPPVPEPHTVRPGTSRPTSTEGSSVSSAQVNMPSGQGGLAAQHRTDITFGEYLTEMANIAIRAASDQERAEALMEALGKVAGALREMAADLVGDHNISTEVTELISDLADAAGRMKQQAERCAEQCGIAKEAARLAATEVARVYGQDMDAKEGAGLKFTSGAAHHD